MAGTGSAGRCAWTFLSIPTPLARRLAVVRAVEDAAGRLDQYPDPACRALVSALAAHEGVREEQILCGGGAAELIYGWCAALRPRRALMPAPPFPSTPPALEAAGCAVERWELKRSNGFQPWPDLLGAPGIYGLRRDLSVQPQQSHGASCWTGGF